jgi:inner membrane protein
MPFRGTWFYGDSVFIMDPALWLILGFGWLANRKPTAAMIGIFIACMAALVYVVGRRSPTYLAVVAVVAVLLFIALMWRTERSLAKPALILACCYIGARLLIHYATALEVREVIGEPIQKLMVAPHPMDPTRWDVVAQTGDVYRYGRFNWRTSPRLALVEDRIPVARPSPEWEIAKRDPSVWGFVTWMRFPWYEVEQTAEGTLVHIGDARYAVRRGRSFGDTSVLIRKRD